MRKIKRWLSLLLLCCLLAGLMPAAHAVTYAALELDTDYDGTYWTVTVKLTGNKRPAMIEFCLEYDSSKVKLKSVKAGSAFSSANAPTYSTPRAGRVLFAWEALTGLKDGKLLVLTFTAKSGARGEAEVYFNEDYNTVFMDASMNDITVSLHRTEIDLDEEPDDDGRRNDDWDDDDWGDDDRDDDDWGDDDRDYDPDATPAPYETDPAGETPVPEETEQPVYSMEDLTVYVGSVCATQEGFLFLSSNPAVVAIENGQLRGVSPGIATVTAYKDGAAVGSCTVTVIENPGAKEPDSGGMSSVLRYVLWGGLALMLGAIIWIVCILIKRRRY